MPSTTVSPASRRGPLSGPLRLLARKLGAHAAILLTGLGGAVVLAFFTWAAGEVYEALQHQSALVALDHPILDWMIAHRTPGLNATVTAFTTVGGPLVTPVVAVLVVAFLAWKWRSWLPPLLLVVATAGSLAVTVVGKNYVGRIRPDHRLAVPPYEFSPSFPSGHSLNSVVIGGVIAYLLWRRWRRPLARWGVVALTVVYSFLMGLSRIYLGHHWTSDVLVGWALGAAWLTVVITVHSVAVEVKEHRALERAQGGDGDEPARLGSRA